MKHRRTNPDECAFVEHCPLIYFHVQPKYLVVHPFVEIVLRLSVAIASVLRVRVIIIGEGRTEVL